MVLHSLKDVLIFGCLMHSIILMMIIYIIKDLFKKYLKEILSSDYLLYLEFIPHYALTMK